LDPVSVLDANAVIWFLDGDARGAELAARLERAQQGRERLLMSQVNWGEVVLAALRAGGDTLASEALAILDRLPIEVVPTDRGLTLQAASFKARGGIAYADCFAAALALREKAVVITGDREFKVVSDVVKVQWL
jgi:predicted nucleic acid-binding protein